MNTKRQFLEAEYNRIGGAPEPDATPRLRHVLKVYEYEPDDKIIITATRNLYPGEPWTGLTLGDLRVLSERLSDA